MFRSKPILMRAALGPCVWLTLLALVRAEQLDSYENVAAKLAAAACTVRMAPQPIGTKSLAGGRNYFAENRPQADAPALQSPVERQSEGKDLSLSNGALADEQGTKQPALAKEKENKNAEAAADRAPRRKASVDTNLPRQDVEQKIAVNGSITIADKLAEPNASTSKNANNRGNEDTIVVCSGAALADGLFITVAPTGQAITEGLAFRITLPGGGQTVAAPRVWDQYTGLVLLESTEKKVAGLKIASDPVTAGTTVLVASGSGIEQPAVSVGVVSAVDRLLPTHQAPLLQCDVHTTESSNGAPLVNRKGELVGIIVTTQQSPERGEWTYALPARHVERIVKQLQKETLVVLPRRWPVAGFELQSSVTTGTMIVDRVQPGGPAANAGIQTGDQIIAIDKKQIRVPQQAVQIIRARQPGDTLGVTVERQGKTTDYSLDLADQDSPRREVDAVSESLKSEQNSDSNSKLRGLVTQEQNRGSRSLRQLSDNVIELRNGGQLVESESAPPAPTASPAVKAFGGGGTGGSVTLSPLPQVAASKSSAAKPLAVSPQIVGQQAGQTFGAALQLGGDLEFTARDSAAVERPYGMASSVSNEQVTALRQEVKRLEGLVEQLRAEMHAQEKSFSEQIKALQAPAGNK
jgi:S1-C subfamily serine protease